jgi:hypothetical protein
MSGPPETKGVGVMFSVVLVVFNLFVLLLVLEKSRPAAIIVVTESGDQIVPAHSDRPTMLYNQEADAFAG